MTTKDKFLAAVEIIHSLPLNGTFQPSENLMLKLYAYHKQATEGPCRISKPPIWDLSARNRWYAWKDLGNMSEETAMEKYVEELTKVIETMSYNEKVSKFMALIGPFYEVVMSDEVDSANEKKVHDGKCVEYPFPKTILESLQIGKEMKCKYDLGSSIKKSKHDNLRQSISRRNSQLYSGTEFTPSYVKTDGVDVFKTDSRVLRNSTLPSQKDLFMLTLTNMQNSMEDIVKKLDDLVILARTFNAGIHEVTNENKNSECENLTTAST
ncbi:Acyl-CoA-binding domain-containing protein 5, partial [Stegodyphus mimosarum]